MSVRSPENARYDWANVIGGLGKLALDRFALDKIPVRLIEAERRRHDAKNVTRKSNDFLAERCDELLVQIAAARDAA